MLTDTYTVAIVASSVTTGLGVALGFLIGRGERKLLLDELAKHKRQAIDAFSEVLAKSNLISELDEEKASLQRQLIILCGRILTAANIHPHTIRLMREQNNGPKAPREEGGDQRPPSGRPTGAGQGTPPRPAPESGETR
jgi:hypothetical protein